MTRVAAIQMTSAREVETNLATAGRLLEEAARAGAKLAALPENFAAMGRKVEERLAIAEADGDGPIQEFLAATAHRLGLWIVGGTFPIRAPGEKRANAACLVYDEQGKRRARYDKIHLFDVAVPDKSEEYLESATIVPGREPVLVDSPAGKLGLAVCYDVRFPELFRSYSAGGAQTLCMPTAFTTPTGRAHWETLVRARAIENLCFMIAPAQSGFHANGRETYGDSMIVDFWGRILARLPRGEGVITAELDFERQAAVRQGFPSLQHRVLSA